jgi:hypothetical protein
VGIFCNASGVAVLSSEVTEAESLTAKREKRQSCLLSRGLRPARERGQARNGVTIGVRRCGKRVCGHKQGFYNSQIGECMILCSS